MNMCITKAEAKGKWFITLPAKEAHNLMEILVRAQEVFAKELPRYKELLSIKYVERLLREKRFMK